MAWYDQFYFNTANSKVQGWLGWELTQSTANNTSTIACNLQFCRQADAYVTSGVYSGTITVSYSVDGTAKKQSANISTFISLSGGKWVVAGVVYFTIPHNANGTQTITVSTSGSIPSTTITSASGSKSSTLTTIPRYATISTYQLDSRTCVDLTVKWAANVTCSAIKYNINDGSWAEKTVSDSSGTFSFSGLSPNTTYKVGLYVKRKDSGLYTTSAKYANFSTHNIPTITSDVNFNIGENITLSVSNPASNSYTISLYANDTLVRTSNATTETSYVWSFTTADLTALYSACPNSKSVAISFKTSVTLNSTTYTATKSGTATVVESSNIPSTPAISLASDNSTVNTVLGVTTKGVQGIGSFTVTVKTASTAKNSATIQNYTCKVIKNDTVYKTTISTSKTIGFTSLSESGDYTVQVYATDSRGFNSAVASTTLCIIAYKAPTLTVKIERVNSYEQEILLDLKGILSKLLIGSTIKNSVKALKYRYAETGSSYGSYVSLSPTTSTSGTDIEATVSYSSSSSPFLTLSSSKSYNIQFYLEDAIQSVVYTTFINQGIPAVSVLENGKLAINKIPVPDGEALQVEGSGRISENLYALKLYENDTALTSKYRQFNYYTGTGTSGSTGYVKLATITIKGTYANTPIEIKVAQRNKVTPTTLLIRFANTNNTDPTLDSFTYNGAITAYLYKSDTSIWDLYILKAETYDSINIIDYTIPSYNASKISITWTNVHADSVPDGATKASPFSLNVNNINASGTITITKTTDLSGTADNSPALIIGGDSTSEHIEIDPNEIQAKGTDATVATLTLNNDGGLVAIGGGGLKVNGVITGTGQLNLGNNSILAGQIELSNNTPYIDFHCERSTVDFTSRIITAGSGILDIVQIGQWGNIRIDSTSGQIYPHTNGGFSLGRDSNRFYMLKVTNGVDNSSIVDIKTQINPFTSALEEIDKTDVFNYKLKDNIRRNGDDIIHTGFVIGEGYNCSDYLISESREGIDLYSAIGVTFGGIKELYEIVKKQQKIIEELKEKINEKL